MRQAKEQWLERMAEAARECGLSRTERKYHEALRLLRGNSED